LPGLPLDRANLFRQDVYFVYYPLPHLADAVVLGLPGESLRRLITLVRSGSGMPLGLGHIFNMHHYRNVFLTTNLFSYLIRLYDGEIVPTGHDKYLETLFCFRPLQARQSFGDTVLGGMIFLRHGDPVPVIPDRD